MTTHSGVVPHAFAIAGTAAWLVTAAVIGIVILADPAGRSVLGVYDTATALWWARLNIYIQSNGFAYLPHFAVLYTPFRSLGAPFGNIAWMLLSVGWLGWVLWQLARRLDPARAGRYFLFATLLSLPLCIGAIRNGQANVVFAAATTHAAIMLMGARWSAAAALLLVAVAIKPLGIVMVLLSPLVYRQLRLRLPIAIAVFMAIPFLFGTPAYVATQYVIFVRTTVTATGVTDHRFANIAGLFRSLGLDLSGTPATVLSLVGAAAALVAWMAGARKLQGLSQCGLLLLVITTSYLMLFNPMSESNSYVILAPVMAAVAILFLDGGHRPAGWLLVGLMLGMGLLPEPLRRVTPDLALWFKPLATAIFIGVTLWIVLGRQPARNDEYARLAVLD